MTVPSNHLPIENGSWLGPYRVDALIGKGAMGWVYRGQHGLLGRDVAIKVLHDALVEDADLVSRFFQEAKVVNAIRHPNIIDVTDFLYLSNPRRVAFVMELLSGKPLSRVISDRSLSPAQIVNVAWQMLDALEAVHAAGVIHRDLKPDNVFITRNLETDLSAVPSIKILDFGVAKVSVQTAHHTITGAIVGTPAYMAPEQVAGEPVGPFTDLYAWAEIVYELLSGRRLFTGTTAAALHRKLLNELPEIDVQISGEALVPLLDVIRRALHRLPSVRPAISEVKSVLYRLGAATGSTTFRTLVLSTVADPPDQRQNALEPHQVQDIEDEMVRCAAVHQGRHLPGLEPVAVLFEDPQQAINYAVALHLLMEALYESASILPRDIALRAKVGIATGSLYTTKDTPFDEHAPLMDSAARLMRLAIGGQTLMTSATAERARRGTFGPTPTTGSPLHWVSHGLYRFEGALTPIEVYEVGVRGHNRFSAPPETEEARCIDDANTIAGWRPAVDQTIPNRPDWTLERRVGESGFAEVWLASERGTDHRHIFKFCFGAGPLKALKREAHLLSILRRTLGDRPDIPRIFRVEISNAPYYLESTYVTGGDLEEWIESRGGFDTLTMSDRLELLARTAEALAAAHSVGVLHRDIKPSNILIDPHDPTGLGIVLSDFGIGGLIDSTDALDPLATSDTDRPASLAKDTLEGTTGTILYMSPERLAGCPASLQSDIYSLGVVFYQLLVGDFRRPVASDWKDDIGDPILREDLTRMLVAAPAKRLADAREVAHRLRDIDERRIQREEEAKKRKAALRAKKFRRVAVPIGIMLTLFGVSMTIQARRIAQEAERANRAAATASRVSDFLVDLFKVSNPGPTRANTVTARDLLDRGAERIQRELLDEPLVRAELMEAISKVYVNLGIYPSAHGLTQKALALRHTVLAPDDPKIADSLAALGLIERLESRFDEAEEAHRRALEIRLKTLGPNHPDTAQSLTMLAQLAYLQGDARTAEQTYRRALEIRERTLGPDTLAVAESLTHLGWLATEQFRYRDAEPMLQRALEIREHAVGHEHPLVAEAMNLLAVNAMNQGQYVQAETLAREALAIRERVLEPDHRRIGNSMTTLGTLHRLQGQLQLSAEDLERAATLLEQALGPENADVGLARFEQGLTYEQLARYDDAAAAFRACLRAYERAFGSEHPSVGQVLNNLGSIVSDRLHDYKSGEVILRRAVKVFDTEGADTYWQALTRWSLANNLRDQGRFTAAEPLYQKTLALLEEKSERQRADNPDLPQLVADYATLLRATQRTEEAEALAKRIE